MSWGVRNGVSGYSGFSTLKMMEESNRALSPSRRDRDGEYENTGFGPLRGYTGYSSRNIKEPASPKNIMKIRGYTGFIEGSKDVHAKPIIPSESDQLSRLEAKNALEEMRRSARAASTFRHASSKSDLEDEHAEQIDPDYDLQERYLSAMEHLFQRGQTPQMLLRTLQGKVSERVKDYASELIKVRKLFEAFDKTGRGSLDVPSFRRCIEYIGCHFDEVQSLALFSFFDDNNDGTVDWTELADHVIMFHPGGGRLVPKVITATMFTEDWESLGRKKALYV